MERPPSAANSVGTSTSQRRNASSRTIDPKAIANNASPVIALFVKNLRLLNLDLLPDWPAITPASLHNDARTRIRCAEWALYQLFRIYDPATTTEKLQPFFPPLEPLQSINLRAGLFRCLNEFKKNGGLGRETVLRKSMLDDCQGDKFWELCFSFSAIVLRKVIVESNNKDGRSVAERIGLSQGLGKSQRESMIPLAVAHKVALCKVLSEKERKRRTYARLYEVLMDKDEDLQERRLQAQEGARSQPRKATIAQYVLDNNWVGTKELRDTIMNGDHAAGGDSLLTRAFDSVWKANEQDKLFTRPAAEIGILEDLEKRAQYQERRLHKWQNFHEKLLSSKPPPSRGSVTSHQSSQLCFDKHQNLTLRDMADVSPPRPPPSRHEKHDSVVKYDEMLTAMREELRKKSATARPDPSPEREQAPRSRPQTQMYRRPSVPPNSIQAASEHHQRSQSQTAVPVRSGIGKRVSSRSRSYQQPKVVSQREPIPLKSEIFSPLKTKRNSMSPASPGRMSMLASPIEDPSEMNEMDTFRGASHRIRQGSSSSVGLGIAAAEEESDASTPKSARSGSENPDSAVELPPRRSSLAVAGRNLDGAGRTMRPSLAERTRLSMAFKSADDIGSIDPTTANHVSLARSEAPLPINTSESQSVLETRSTLHDRTRQSISAAPASTAVPLKIHKKPAHSRSRTSLYPINQFETPEKSRRRSTVTLELNNETRDRSITPKEKLFEADAEYTSIFKARPKIALSPIISPQFTESSINESVNVDDVGMSSPLVGKNE
ncbi:Hypothetical predicted protein [Lecanosticta acicola]|uniref:HAUS augmin-like complex subunit 6 N-terminal domain-containing protein n=1 Tax=Lecanosticta acicola TaxID=111012 RepID=A0AAI9EC55_9PEZI|nr:Hypothetical predicted protein [Lecanosticta acicola]